MSRFKHIILWLAPLLCYSRELRREERASHPYIGKALDSFAHAKDRAKHTGPLFSTWIQTAWKWRWLGIEPEIFGFLGEHWPTSLICRSKRFNKNYVFCCKITNFYWYSHIYYTIKTYKHSSALLKFKFTTLQLH